MSQLVSEEAGSPETNSAFAQGLTEKPESAGRQIWRRFLAHRLAIVGVGMLIVIVAMAFLGPVISEFEFDALDVRNRNQGPSAEHWFGTDELGRDLFVRTTRGAQTSIVIAIITASVSVIIGTVIGSFAGYGGARTDGFMSFLTNLFLTVPPIALLLVFAVRFGGNPVQIALLVAAVSWTRSGRIVRAQMLQLKEQEFVLAARAAGAGPLRIVWKHLLPNSIGPILVDLTLLTGTAIILESTLSFLGLGVRPPDATLGTLVADAKGKIATSPSAVLLPGAAITLIVLSINFIGDALRDAFDPKATDDR